MEKKVKKESFIGAIFLPGNEIPEWLSFQNVGSSVNFELPLAYLKNDPFVRCTVCLVVAFPDRYKLIGKDRYGETVRSGEDTYRYKFQCGSLISHNVILLHFDPIRWGRTETEFVTFDFSGENYNVKKCGVKVIFQEV
ncbi:hypothetical protein Patl1_22488 [Pistacia atlantica]|uniref:Uncharacterized protein n=1 Tax=Pistacia atlantica TaxID=434234 RepID=A0ACC1A276_9ROSI|nr:hypothetical protein Patl1_22488 [Pistacia atlantica]